MVNVPERGWQAAAQARRPWRVLSSGDSEA
jgi:hypothetical protein